MPNLDEVYDNVINMGDKLKEDNKEKTISLEDAAKVAQKIQEVTSKDEVLSYVQDLPSNNGVSTTPAAIAIPTEDPVSVVANIDPMSGEYTVVGDADDVLDKSEEINLEDYLDMSKYEKENADIDSIDFESFKATYGINEDDIKDLVPILKRVQKGEEFSVYPTLPKSLQRNIDAIVMSNGGDKKLCNTIAKDMMNSMMTDIGVDLFQIDIDKLMQDEINKSSADMSSMYIDLITTKKQKMFDAAEKVEKESPDTAKVLREIGLACEQSYTYEKFKAAISNHDIKIKKYEMGNPDKVFRDFCYKYINNKMAINNVSDIIYCIPRHLATASTPVDPEKITKDTIVAFAVLFCKYCWNFTANDVPQHTFMYYFIKNILSLDITPEGMEAQQFSIDLVDNIKECLELVHEKYGY